MKEKGQIFTLDFLLSVILIALAAGFLIRSIELSSYSQKQEEIYYELKTTAENAGNLLAANPAINCSVERINTRIMNCLDTTILTAMTAQEIRKELAIPQTIAYKISVPGIPAIQETARTTEDFATVKRKVLLHNGSITKSEFNTIFRNQPVQEVSIETWQK